MKLFVEKDWDRRSTRFLLCDDSGRERIIIGVKNGELVKQVLNDIHPSSEKIYPLLEMGDFAANEFIKAVVDYASGEGIKTENENLLKGKLLATEKHLEDLRRQFDLVLNKIITAT